MIILYDKRDGRIFSRKKRLKDGLDYESVYGFPVGFIDVGDERFDLLDYEVTDGQITRKSTVELELREVQKKSTETRLKRNSLLAETDWTQVPDSPVNKKAWADYRQALRDITSQKGYPLDVVWPEPPEEKKGRKK